MRDSFDSIVKSVNRGEYNYGSALEDRKRREKENQPRTHESFNEIISSVNRGEYDFDVDDNYINSFISDSQNYLKDAQNDYNSIQYGDYKSKIKADEERSSALRARAGNIRAYMNVNKDRIDQNKFDEMMNYLDNYKKGSNDVAISYNNLNNFYNQFKSQSEYDTFKKEEKYRKMTADEVNAEIERLTSERDAYKKDNGGKFKNTIYKVGSYLMVGDDKTVNLGHDIREDAKENIKTLSDYDAEIEKLNTYKLQKDQEKYLSPLDEETLQLLDDYNDASNTKSELDWEGVLAAMSGTPGGASTGGRYSSAYSKQDNALKKIMSKGYTEEEARNLIHLRKTQKETQDTKETIEDFRDIGPVGKFLYPTMKPFVSGAGALVNLQQSLENKANGVDYGINPTSSANSYSLAIQQMDADNINSIKSNLGKFAYKSAMGIRDNLTRNIMAGGSAGLDSAMLLGEVFNDGIIEGKVKGYSDSKAITMGLLQSSIEALTNKYGLEFSENAPSALRTILRSFVSEGSEEVTSNWLNNALDNLVNVNNSDINKEYNKYITDGMNKKTALKKVAMNVIGEDIESFLIGGISGAGMQGGKIAINNTIDSQIYKSIGEQTAMKGNIPELLKSSEGFELSDKKANQKFQKLRNNVEKLSTKEFKQLSGKEKKEIGQFAKDYFNERGKEFGSLYKSEDRAVIKEFALDRLQKANVKNAKYVAEIITKANYETLNNKEQQVFDTYKGKRILSDALSLNNSNKAEIANNIKNNYVESAVQADNFYGNAEAQKYGDFKYHTLDTVETVTDYIIKDVKKKGNNNYSYKIFSDNLGEIDSDDANLDIGDMDQVIGKAIIAGSNDKLVNDVLSLFKKNNSERIAAGLEPTSGEEFSLAAQELIYYGKFGFDNEKTLFNDTDNNAIISQQTKESLLNIGRTITGNEVYNSGHYKRQGNGKVDLSGISQNKLKNLSARQKTGIETANVISTIMDSKIVFLESYKKNDNKRYYKDETGAEKEIYFNGMYNPNNDTIYVDINSENELVSYAIAHEVVHQIRARDKESFLQLSQFLKAEYDNNQVPASYFIQKRVSDGEDYDLAYEEWVAESFSSMLADENVETKLKALYKQNRTLFEKIKDAVMEILQKIDDIIKNIKDGVFKGAELQISDEAKVGAVLKEESENLKTAFVNAVEQAGGLKENNQSKTKDNKSNNDGNFTVIDDNKFQYRGLNKYGIEVYETSISTKSLSYKERINQFKKLMNEKYYGRTAKFNKNGNVYYAKFSKYDINKNIYDLTNGQKEKINVGAEGDIFELVENSIYHHTTKETGKKNKAHKNVLEWDYFIKNVQIDNAVYNLLANIRKTEKDNYVYSIDLKKDKKIEVAPALGSYPKNGKNLKDGLPTTSIDNNITQNNNIVNKQYMHNNKKILLKEKQFNIIKEYNPAPDSYHTWIRNISDIKTFEEAIEDKESFVWGDYSRDDALRDLNFGKVKVYSSNDIMQGMFVSTSYNQALEYAGGNKNKVKSQTVSIDDVAWINGDEGMYAKVSNDIRYQERKMETDKKSIEREEHLKDIAKYYKNLLKIQDKITNGKIADLRSCNALAKVLIKDVGSKADISEVGKEIAKLYGAIAQNKTIDKNIIQEQSEKIAEKILETSHMTTEKDDYNAKIRSQLKNVVIKLDNVQKEEVINEFGSYSNFRNVIGNTVRLNEKIGSSLDSVWQDLHSLYPDMFDSEINPADMGTELAHVVMILQDNNQLANQMLYDEQLRYLTDKVMYGYGSIAKIKTTADKITEKYQQQYLKLVKQYREIENYNKETHDEKMTAIRDFYSITNADAIKALQEEYQKQFNADYREKHKADMEKRIMIHQRHQIWKSIDRMKSKLLNPKKEKNVALYMQPLVCELLLNINMDKVDADFRIEELQEKMKHTHNPELLSDYQRRIENLKNSDKNKKFERAEFKERLNSIKSKAEKRNNEELGEFSFEDYDAPMVELVKSLSHELKDIPIRRMSASQIKDVYNAVRGIESYANSYKTILLDGKKQNIENAGHKIINEIYHNVKEKREEAIISQKIKRFGWSLLKPETALQIVGSETLQNAFYELSRGDNVFSKDIREAKEKISSLYNKYDYTSWDLEEVHDFDLPSGKLSLTTTELMSLYAYSKREHAIPHLESGGFVRAEPFTKKFLGKIPLKYDISIAGRRSLAKFEVSAVTGEGLTKEQRKFVDEIVQYLTSMGEKGNEVSRILYQIDLFNEKVYFPIKSANQFLSLNSSEANKRPRKMINQGFTKGLTVDAKNPIVLEDFMKIVSDHIVRMSQYHAYAIALENFTKLFGYVDFENGSVRDVIESHSGKAATEYINNLILDANGARKSDNNMAEIFFKPINRFKKIQVSASLSTAIQQPTAIIRAMSMIDPKYFVTNNDEKINYANNVDEMRKYAEIFYLKELGGFDMSAGININEFLKSPEYDKLPDKVKSLFKKDPRYRDEMFMFLAGKGDEVAWQKLWSAVKSEQRDKLGNEYSNLSRQEFLNICGERFTRICMSTQVYDSIFTRSEIMRSPNALNKVATSFAGEPITNLNMIVNSIVNLSRGKIDKKEFSKNITSVVFSQVAAATLVSIIYAMRDSDDDESLIEKYVQALSGKLFDEIVLLPITSTPYIRDFNSILQGFSVDRMDTELFSALAKAMKDLGSDTKPLNDRILTFALEFSAFFGLPFKNIAREIRGIINTITCLADDIYPNNERISNAFIEGIIGESNMKKLNNKKMKKVLNKGDETDIRQYCDNAVRVKTEHYVNMGKEKEQAKKDAISNIKSKVTSTLKPKYIEAVKENNNEKMNEIRKIIFYTGFYKDLSEVDKKLKAWRKESEEQKKE